MMLRGLRAGLLAALVLAAGCTSPVEQEPEPANIPQTTTDGVLPPAPPGVAWEPLETWQPLYLGVDNVTGVPPAAGAVDLLEAEWTYTMQNPATVDGGWATFHVIVTEQIPLTSVPGPDGWRCAWHMGLQLVDSTTQYLIGVPCVMAEGLSIPPGEYTVRFELQLLAAYPVEVEANATWTFSFSAAGIVGSNGGAGEVLVGEESPSHVRLEGLAEPFPRPLVPCQSEFSRMRETYTDFSFSYATLLGAKSGTGGSIRVDEYANRTSLDLEWAWDFDAELEIEVYEGNETHVLSGPSPLSISLGNAQDESQVEFTVYLANDGVAYPGGAIHVVAWQTFDCPDPRLAQDSAAEKGLTPA